VTTQAPITDLLHRWGAGDGVALEQLTPLVYEELRRRAGSLFRGEAAGHTLQPTALVHELYDRLAPAEVDWRNRTHFYALCARMMRRILVDHAKARRAAKRGGDAVKLTVDVEVLAERTTPEDLFTLDEALEALSALDARKAELIELQVFGGLTFREMETVTGLSSSTLDRELRFARAWLKARLAGA
jgi:RNA polymerase sigma factor (TIGR02999 family)